MTTLRTRCGAGLGAALIVIMVAPAVAQTQANAVQPTAARSSNAVAAIPVERVELLVGRSTVLRVDRPIKRVSLPKPEIADALVTGPYEVLVHGKMPGTISLLVWGDNGDIRTFDVSVRRDLSELEQRVRQLFPGEPIQISSNGGDVVLSGVVSSKYVVDKAASLAGGYVEKADNVVNLLRQQEGVASNQVLLRVRFAEVSRSALQELGVSLFTSPTGIENTIGRVTTQQFSAPGFESLEWTKDSGDFGAPVTSAKGEFTFGDFLNIFLFSQRYDIGAMVRALSSKGLFQSLAEPNLVTQNGKEASFLAGGEYPYPVAHGTGGATSISVEFKEFGIRLKFTPTVIGNDLIHLKLAPEVSSLDFGNAVTMNGFRIPALTSRRTATEVELRDGQTFAIAGLIDNSLTQTMSKVPGLGDIPILGTLFKSRAYQKNSTELVVMITPQILRRDSTGVTPNLPALEQPYLDRTPRKNVPMPPPAFTTGSPSAAAAGQAAPVAKTPATVSPGAASAGTASASTASAGTASASTASASTASPAKAAPARPMPASAAPAYAAPANAAPVQVDAPVVNRQANERLRRVDEKRAKEDEKRMREEQERARKLAEAEAKKQAELEAKRETEALKQQLADQKKRDAEQKKREAEQKKMLEEQKKELAEQQKKAQERLRKLSPSQRRTVAPQSQPETEQAEVVYQPIPVAQQADVVYQPIPVAHQADVVYQPIPAALPSAEEMERRLKNLEAQRAEAERKKTDERKKAQQKAAKRRALSDPYPPLRSRRNW